MFHIEQCRRELQLVTVLFRLASIACDHALGTSGFYGLLQWRDEGADLGFDNE
jgi:hypothetical protein